MDFDDCVFEKSHVHIRIQQRNGRKSITTVQGLSSELDLKKMMKVFKKVFCCNGSLSDNDHVIQFQGDQRKNVAEFLVAEKLVSKENLKIHGF